MCEDKSTKSNWAHAQDRTNHKSLCAGDKPMWLQNSRSHSSNFCMAYDEIADLILELTFRKNSRKVDEHFSLFVKKNFTETKESQT